MKVVSKYIPKSYVMAKITQRNEKRAKFVKISKHINQEDKKFLLDNKDKLERYANRQNCALDFRAGTGNFNGKTRMDVYSKENQIIPDLYSTYTFDMNFNTQNICVVPKYKSSVLLPEDTSNQKETLNMIKDRIRIIKNRPASYDNTKSFFKS